MLCSMYGGEILNEFEIGDFERPPQQFFVYLSLFKENKSGNKKGLYRFWTPGSLNFIESKNEKFFKAPNCFLFYLYHLLLFLFLFSILFILFLFY